VPDWVCEVLSPSTRRLDLTEKRDRYAAAGVRHLWLVDPDARTLEAFEAREGQWLLIAALKDDEEVRVAPFDAVPFSLSALWPD
jgi:Uma2 family endonuclease